mgnify:CR=1 FL=1
MGITNLTLIETLKAIKEKQFSLEELNRSYLERIEKYNHELNAFLDINKIGFAGMKTTLFRLKADKINIKVSDVIHYLEVKKQIKGEKNENHA